MIHKMKLKEQYFNYIKDGTKEYEIRLNDLKRRNIKIGDLIIFELEPTLEEKIILEVEDLLYYDSFNSLINSIDISLLATRDYNKEHLISDLEKFYSYESQKEYGVVAIKLNKNNIINYTDINKISSNNKIFNILRNNYSDFDNWINKLKSSCDKVFYTKNNKEISSILILKLNENDSQQFKMDGNILKIRTLYVNDTNKGIATNYLKLIDSIARINNINYVYLTIKNTNNLLINFITNKGYIKYNDYLDEYVYYKEIV